MLAVELGSQRAATGMVGDILSLLSVFECRSPRLAEILESAADCEDPDIRWRAAALRESISSPKSRMP
ncbi:MAG: hypothetical protein WD875_14845 [Pirellulales bacterium]